MDRISLHRLLHQWRSVFFSIHLCVLLCCYCRFYAPVLIASQKVSRKTHQRCGQKEKFEFSADDIRYDDSEFSAETGVLPYNDHIQNEDCHSNASFAYMSAKRFTMTHGLFRIFLTISIKSFAFYSIDKKGSQQPKQPSIAHWKWSNIPNWMSLNRISMFCLLFCVFCFLRFFEGDKSHLLNVHLKTVRVYVCMWMWNWNDLFEMTPSLNLAVGDFWI